MYRQNQQRIQWERETLALEIEELSRNLDGDGEVRIAAPSEEMLTRVQEAKKKDRKMGRLRSENRSS